MTLTIFILVALLTALAFGKKQLKLAIILVAFSALLGILTSFKVALTLLIAANVIALGQPLFVVLGIVSAAALLSTGDVSMSVDSISSELGVLITKALELATKEVLLAIPFFVLAGEVMTQGSLAKRLIDVASAALGWLPGGLAIATVLACIFFAAISGSSPVTVIAIGSIMLPALRESGYPDRFSVGLISTAGSLGILIPPSIPMIVYAIMVGTTTPIDPKDLFIAGLGPGLLIGLMLALYSMVVGVRSKLPRQDFSFSELLTALRRGFFSLCLPLLILGGIYSGLFTATEAAVVSVFYALGVELFIHRDLRLAAIPDIVQKAMTMMGALFMIIAMALGLNHVLVLNQIPDQLVEILEASNLTPFMFLISLNLLLLAAGFLMDIMSAILIIAPMLAPLGVTMGIDPLHLGIIFIVNLEIGYCTPPIGLNLFVSSVLFKKPISFVIRSVLAPLGIMLVGLVIVTWVPQCSSGVVYQLQGKGTAQHPSSGAESGPASLKPDDSSNASAENRKSGRVKSLEELMADSQSNESAKEANNETEIEKRARVKSLEELMMEAEEED